MGRILTGTSGYDYPEWVGAERFYPPSLERRRDDWLTYYASQFPLVELNFTYYGETSPKQLERMLKRVEPQRSLMLLEGDFRPMGGFQFVIKAYASLTHQIGDEWRAAAAKFCEDIAPLSESGRLAGVLAQFPARFHFSQQTATYVVRLSEELQPSRVIAEFRHHSWFQPKPRELLQRHGVVVAGVDAPDEAKLPRVLEDETEVAPGTANDEAATAGALPFTYMRLHGRREGSWWAGDAASRYEYRYSDWQLQQLARLLLTHAAVKTYALFNNHRHADAAKNAYQLMAIMDALLKQAGGPVENHTK